jgi:hypothetical protein
MIPIGIGVVSWFKEAISSLQGDTNAGGAN